ncbi:MAG: pilus assembly PilX N-terminal domain-containing protein [bacterium]|nr:pilus assembly PilX N-terminal domain-containing protein [bacterium]
MKKKGIALVTTIMILLLMTALATGMMFTIKNETAISVYQASTVKVIAVAEAALDEVKHRMNLEPTDSLFIGDTGVPLTTTWKTFIQFGSGLPDDDSTNHIYYRNSLQNYTEGFSSDNPELDYTTEDFDSNLTLAVHHKLSSDGTQIYFFDSKTQKQFLGPPTLVTEYPPVEIVEITARSGKAVKKIMAEISKQEVNIKVQSALSSATIVWQMTGNTDIYVCGHNHLMSTPYNVCPFDPTSAPPHVPGSAAAAVSCWEVNAGSGSFQTGMPSFHVQVPFDSDSHPGYNHYFYDYIHNTWNINRIEYDQFCTRAGCLAGIATTSTSVGNYGAAKSHIFGNPDIIIRYDVVIPELFEVLGFSSEDEMENSIDWENSLVSDETTVRYFKLGSGPLSTVAIPTANDTRTMGIIWIDGNLRLNAGARNFQHKGLVYVSGDLLETSTPGGNYDIWILGAMMVKGDIDDIHTSGNKRMFFMYSKESLSQTVESDLRFFKLLGWKEIL